MQRLRILLGHYHHDGKPYGSSMSARTSESSIGISLVTIPQTIVGDTVAYPWMRRLRNAIMRRIGASHY
jgi:hypothetical protein